MNSTGLSSPSGREYFDNNTNNNDIIPAAGTAALSLVSTLTLLYVITQERGTGKKGKFKNLPRSTPLPGFGILGDRINEFVSIFLDALAIYVHKYAIHNLYAKGEKGIRADRNVFSILIATVTANGTAKDGFYAKQINVPGSMESFTESLHI